MSKVSEIKGTITLADGSSSEFSIGRDLIWQQWGAVTSRLGITTEVLDALVAGLVEADIDVQSSNDEEN